MRAQWRLPSRIAGLLCVLFLLSGCAPLIAEYSLEAYKNATSLKAEALDLIDKSGEPYARRREEAEALTTKINAAYEFAAGTAYNQLSARQWQILRDPNGQLYGGYITFWKRRGTMSNPRFRMHAKNLIGAAFDEIICLEANKQALKPCYQTAAQAKP